MNLYVADWHADDGHHTVLAKEGRSKYHMVVIDFPVKHVSVPKTEGRYLRPVDYSPTKAARSIRKFARAAGITQAAKAMLKEAV